MSQSVTTREGKSGRVRSAAARAIKEPVKEAVREALAEGVQQPSNGTDGSDENESNDATGTPTTDVDEASESDESARTAETADEESESNQTSRSLPRRLLGSRRSVGAFALVAGALYLRRRRNRSATGDGVDADTQ